MRRFAPTIAVAALLVGVLAAPVSASSTGTGTWTAFPGQTASYSTSVLQPINADGTSVYKAARGVIPVQFSLKSGVGPFVFASMKAGTPVYSALDYTPAATLTASHLTSLSSVYAFATGDCYGGSMRWSIETAVGNVFVYYGAYPAFTDCTTANQSTINLLQSPDLRFDTSQVGGTFYDTWAHAQTLLGSNAITDVALVLDGGWGGDQVVTLTSATVGIDTNTSTFTPDAASAAASTCNLPAATIKISYVATGTTTPVDETLVSAVNDNGTSFRIVDCKYMYNLAVSSLSGPGTYTVSALVNGIPATGAATFALK